MVVNPITSGGGGGEYVTGRLNSYDITVYGETDNDIINFDYFTDYNVRLGSILVCVFSGPYGSGFPSGLEYVYDRTMGLNTVIVLKVTGNFVIYTF